MYTPSREEFVNLAKQGNVIPVTRRFLADFETPLSAYHKIRGQGESFLAESVEGGERLGRYSFVGCNPRAIIRQDGSTVKHIENGKVLAEYTVTPGQATDNPKEVRDGLEAIERILSVYRPVALPNLPRFTGGAIGFIGYEFIHDVEPVVPRPARDDLQTPTMYFVIADQLIIFDRVDQTITILVNAFTDDSPTAMEAYENATEEIERLETLLEQPIEHHQAEMVADIPEVDFTSNTEKDQFLANVAKSKEYITAGDIIQVVGSQRFSTDFQARPIDLYRAARTIQSLALHVHVGARGPFAGRGLPGDSRAL